MLNEKFTSEGGIPITIRPMWGEFRVVWHATEFCRIGKNSYASYAEARAKLIANSTRVS